MGRPAKASALKRKHETKEEKARQSAFENSFDCDMEDPPESLTEAQVEIYLWIYENLKKANVSTRLDKVVISNAAVVIDTLNFYIDEMNKDPMLRLDSKFMGCHQKALSNFFKLCTELCLSPASRAKLGGIVAKQAIDNKDPLAELLGGAMDE